MDLIVTKASWECKVPEALRQQGESYWCLAELPVDTESIFIVNAVSSAGTPERHLCMLVVSIEQLLDVLERTGVDAILSVYVVHRSAEGFQDQIFADRITAIRAGDSKELGWKKVFICETHAGQFLVNTEDCSVADRLINETEIIRLPAPTAAVA